MQFGHLPLALSIATFDWSAETALFCVATHWLPNADSLVTRMKWDKVVIRVASRFEAFLKGQDGAQVNDRAPESDPFWEEAGGFHCTITHSIFFAFTVSLVVSFFSIHLAILAMASILAHYVADLGSTAGLPLLWPLSRKKFSLGLFKDTGYWGREMLAGYYRQPMAWALELCVLMFFLYRLGVVYQWPL